MKNNNPYIKSPRQYRAINALLEHECVKVRELGPMIGAENPRQVIMELRRQGFSGRLLTRRFTIIDQDGKQCRPGEYYFPYQFKQILKNAVVEYEGEKGNFKSHTQNKAISILPEGGTK